MRSADGGQAGPLRQVSGLLRLSGVQNLQSHFDRRVVSSVQGRVSDREANQARPRLLRLPTLPGLQVRFLGPADARSLSVMWVSLPASEVFEEERSVHRLSEQGLLLSPLIGRGARSGCLLSRLRTHTISAKPVPSFVDTRLADSP